MLENDQAIHSKSIFPGENSVKQFRAELIKTMTEIIICRRLNEKSPPGLTACIRLRIATGKFKICSSDPASITAENWLCIDAGKG